MNKYEIVKKIEEFAPTETAQSWDYVGFIVETTQKEISKVMLCLTPTKDIVKQAFEKNCDMIISHHPLFFVPNCFANIDIYCAHTNMDLANGGTTDTLIKALDLNQKNLYHDGFLRYVELDNAVKITEFAQILRKISPNLRYTNNKNIETIKKIAFCAGSGSEFIELAQQNDADCLVTGDLKFHTALESDIVVFDIGHFESEILILDVFKKIIGKNIEIVIADEKSPFIYW